MTRVQPLEALSEFFGVARGPEWQTGRSSATSMPSGVTLTPQRDAGVPGTGTCPVGIAGSAAKLLSSGALACITFWRMLCKLLGIMTRICLSEFFGVAKRPGSKQPPEVTSTPRGTMPLPRRVGVARAATETGSASGARVPRVSPERLALRTGVATEGAPEGGGG